MTKRLILIRHAKSSWNDPYADDHSRPLNNRGRHSATAIGRWLARHDYRPEKILCSDAARTVETADLIMPELADRPGLQLSHALYHAAPEGIWQLLRKQTASVVAVIGHNPGIGMLANGLVTSPPHHPRFQDYPTCATTVIDIPDANSDRGACVAFVVPRDLIGTQNGPD